MKRICPRCQIEMKNNCYVKDLGKSSLSYLQLIVQNDTFSKAKFSSIFSPVNLLYFLCGGF